MEKTAKLILCKIKLKNSPLNIHLSKIKKREIIIIKCKIILINLLIGKKWYKNFFWKKNGKKWNSFVVINSLISIEFAINR